MPVPKLLTTLRGSSRRQFLSDLGAGLIVGVVALPLSFGTPVAGIVHAVTLLLILLFFGRWAALTPLPALAAILLVVAYHLSG